MSSPGKCLKAFQDEVSSSTAVCPATEAASEILRICMQYVCCSSRIDRRICLCGAACTLPPQQAFRGRGDCCPDWRGWQRGEDSSREDQCRCKLAGLAKAVEITSCHRRCISSAPVRQSTCSIQRPSLCPMQDLSADELQQVFKSGLHLSDWAMLRLVSKTWKALADSCADCVNVSLTCAEWPEQPMEKSAEHDWQVVQPWVTEAAFSRLCYVL